jgi:hypothetical protein
MPQGLANAPTAGVFRSMPRLRARRSLRKVAGGRPALVTKAKVDPLGAGYWLPPMMQQRFFCGPQHQLVSYDNEFTVSWRRGFDWKQRP